jgi:hypothetical protein
MDALPQDPTPPRTDPVGISNILFFNGFSDYLVLIVQFVNMFTLREHGK